MSLWVLNFSSLMQMILSFEMPFALIPLLKFCNSSKKVGPLKESIYVSLQTISSQETQNYTIDIHK